MNWKIGIIVACFFAHEQNYKKINQTNYKAYFLVHKNLTEKCN